MNRQRKVVITVTYNEFGTIVDTKAEELDSSAQPEIIRCKDCRKNPNWEWVGCPMTGKDTRKPDDFCSYAERKSNG